LSKAIKQEPFPKNLKRKVTKFLQQGASVNYFYEKTGHPYINVFGGFFLSPLCVIEEKDKELTNILFERLSPHFITEFWETKKKFKREIKSRAPYQGNDSNNDSDDDNDEPIFSRTMVFALCFCVFFVTFYSILKLLEKFNPSTDTKNFTRPFSYHKFSSQMYTFNRKS
jgi:hypothetical protein